METSWPPSWHIDQATADEIHGHRTAERLVHCQTQFQKLEIFRTPHLGLLLCLDGITQGSQADEAIYHETLVHPALLSCSRPRRCLVIGGGEGATLRELYRHPQVEEVVMVDIDGEVVEACRKHLPTWHAGAFDDPRTRLIVDDARHYMEELAADERFDLIVVDISDALEGTPAFYMFTQEFYQRCFAHLNDDGIIVTQSGGNSSFDQEYVARIGATLSSVFNQVQQFTTFIPSFALEWTFSMASKSKASSWLPKSNQIDGKLAELGYANHLSFYDGETHRKLFALPRALRRARQQSYPPFTLASKPELYKADLHVDRQ